jgi:hypothetical protein
MVDYHFDYHSFTCDADELQAHLDELGARGWRLHTCEPYVVQGVEGVGTLKIFCVMDIGPIPNEELEKPETEGVEDLPGIPLR